MRKILITGGAGFIGTHCVQWFARRYPNYFLVNLDKITYAARPDALESMQHNPNYCFVSGDICDSALVKTLFQRFNFDSVIHLAAETHVDRSIVDPLLFVQTNVTGTAVLLQAAYEHWFKGPNQPKSTFETHRFLHVSTDEVYGALNDNHSLFVEHMPLAPNNPYSASKAGGECLVRSYGHTYGLNTVITRSTNNYGSGQHREKLISMVLHCALAAKPILLHGTGGSIRDWLHVEDHCSAMDILLHQGQPGQCYNIGARMERTNLSVAQTICTLLDACKPLKNKSYASLISFCAERLGQDRRYALDTSKITQSVGWKPSIGFETGLQQLVHQSVGCSDAYRH